MSYPHFNDELPDEFKNGDEFCEGVRNNLNDIWRNMAFGASVIRTEDVDGVFLAEGHGIGWDLQEVTDFVASSELYPAVMIYRREIETGKKLYEYIRQEINWSQTNGASYNRIDSITLSYSKSGSEYVTVGIAELVYNNTTNHYLTELNWAMPESDDTDYWYFQDDKPDFNDNIVDCFDAIKRNQTALKDIMVFGAIVPWTTSTSTAYRPTINLVPGWDMSCTASTTEASSVDEIIYSRTDSVTDDKLKLVFTWNTTTTNSIDSCTYYYSSDGTNYNAMFKVDLTFNDNTYKVVTDTTHTVYTSAYTHYNPAYPDSGNTGSAVIQSIGNNLKALLHYLVIGDGFSWKWNDPPAMDADPELELCISNVPYWEVTDVALFDIASDRTVTSVQLTHKTNTSWKLDKKFDTQRSTAEYYFTENNIANSDNTKIARLNMNEFIYSDLYLAKRIARLTLRGEIMPNLIFKYGKWIQYTDSWTDT